ncbi:hypothetical protein J2739_005273 [Variovorax soli]|uniref:Transposase n=1 Tax=Variovorax soli TaxID=376815 RepID=A0ABU1NM09_9BURK|nr:hypothetical protein [Variovorax soli]
MKPSNKSYVAAPSAIRFLIDEPGVGWRNYPLNQGLPAYTRASNCPPSPPKRCALPSRT